MRKKIRYVLFFIIFFIIVLNGKSFARITTNDPTVNSGDSAITITVNSQEGVASGAIDIQSNDGLTLKSVTGGTVNGSLVAFATQENKTNGLATYTFEVPNVTETKTYKVVFFSKDMADKEGNPVESSTATATVTVKAKTVTQPNPPPTTTTPEPTFTDVNETVYAKDTVNVRESYTTSSKVLGTLQKGKEIVRIGKGSNGWSKVTYNGKTAYISSDYLTTTKPVVEEEKSSNANLKSLTIENQELVPSFSSSTLSYATQVTNDVTTLTIEAETEDEKATISIGGNENLKEGKNTVTISVSAEDGTVKIYEIEVTRLEKEVDLALQSLKIKDTDIEEMFQPEVYQYTIQVEEVTKLEIEATANDENATVEIIGNEDLKDGENVITIIVSSQDGSKKVTYQIKVNKIALQEDVAKKQFSMDINFYLYIVLAIVIFLALVLVIVYTIKHRNQENDENDEFEDNLGEEEEKENSKEEIDTENKKSKIDYFIDNDIEENKNKRGKHF